MYILVVVILNICQGYFDVIICVDILEINIIHPVAVIDTIKTNHRRINTNLHHQTRIEANIRAHLRQNIIIQAVAAESKLLTFI